MYSETVPLNHNFPALRTGGCFCYMSGDIPPIDVVETLFLPDAERLLYGGDRRGRCISSRYEG